MQAPTISLPQALHHCFDAKKKKFHREATKEHLTLEEAVKVEWINGMDVVYDVSSNNQTTLREAISKGVINGKTCEYTRQRFCIHSAISISQRNKNIWQKRKESGCEGGQATTCKKMICANSYRDAKQDRKGSTATSTYVPSRKVIRYDKRMYGV